MKPLKEKTRREQDYWLTYCDKPGFVEVTEDERLEFHLFDSRGIRSDTLEDNPILWGKTRHGQYMSLMRQFDDLSKREGWWPFCIADADEIEPRILEAAFGKDGAERRVRIARLQKEVL